jgi:hypothetical protein
VGFRASLDILEQNSLSSVCNLVAKLTLLSGSSNGAKQTFN